MNFLDPVQFFDYSRDVAMATNFVSQAKHKPFAIFTPHESVLGVDYRSEIFFSISQGTLPWQPILWQNCGKITYPLHLSLCHSETEWDIANSIRALKAQMMPLYRMQTL